MSAPTTSSSCTNCTRGSKPKISGDDAASSTRARTACRWSLPSTFANRSSVTATCGLSSAKSRRNASTSSNERSTRGARRARARHVLAEHVRVLEVRAVHERRALHHDLAHRAPGRAGGREQVHRADDVDLVQRAAAGARRVDDQVRVQRSCRSRSRARCGRGSSTTSRRARTRCVRAAPADLACRGRRSTSTSGRCSSACATRPPQYVLKPVTRTRIARSAEPDAAPLAQHVVERVLHHAADALGLFHHPAARVALLVGRDVEVHRRQHADLELRGEVRRTRPAGPNISMFAVTGKYGMFSIFARRVLLNTIGIDSSAPTTASGMTGTPARIAISTNPPRPNRRSW